MPESLKNKTIKGTFWSAADALLGYGVTFLVGIILARLLSPAEYGLIGIVLIFTTIMTGLVDSGFSNALIRKTDVTETDYNTMFWANLTISIFLFILLYITAPYIASFFKNVELIGLIRAMGLILIFQALSFTQVTKLTKNIDFKTKTKASLFSSLSSGIIGIVMAYRGYGVWALVGQQISAKLLYSISLWYLLRWWPSFQFSFKSFHYMWGFGWKIMISGLLNNLWNQLYQVVIVKCYTPSTLGQYTRAYEYASIFSSNFSSIIQRVTFPVISGVQNDKERMVSAYRRIIKTTMFVTSMPMVLLCAISEPLIYCLIGPKWHEASTYLPFISLSMSLYPLHAINLNMLQVQGRSDIYLYLEIVKKIIAIIPICLGIFINIYWMLAGSIVIGIACFFLNSFYTGKSLGYSSWMQIKDIMPSYSVAFFSTFVIYFFKYLPLSYWYILPLQVIVGIVIIIFICEKIKMEEYYEIKNLAYSLCKRFKNEYYESK